MWFEQLLWCFEKSFPDAQKGLYVYWKHTLETLSFGNIICVWKQKMYIGNIHWILEPKIGYWKHKKAFGNINCILETYLLYWKHRFVYWKHCIWKHKNDNANNAYGMA